ncbi:AfsR/SARP family transcriptional regulator [Streptomyces alkaliphilus]|nr:BTAD domain-containing putative transcriptional regulator [Streptomyces alkaliphilus]
MPVTARRQQIVLALLLMESGRGVTLDSLVSAVWGPTPPVTARAQIQTTVSSLRGSLEGAGLGRRIEMRGARYTLDLAHGEVDLHLFDDLAAEGRSAAAESRQQAARTAFRSALALWRGDPLSGTDSPVVQARLVQLAERRFTVLEACLDAELKLGLHHDVLGEIIALAGEFPLRERPAEQLMTALYRCGRPAEALATYRRVRRTFIDELGIELSPPLRRLELAILNGSAELDRAPLPSALPFAPVTVPRSLPARVADFTGREDRLREVCGALTGSGEIPGQPENDRAGPVVVLTGGPGVGKSALAVEAAHLLAPDFPDGQLYARLPDGDPLRAVEHVLGHFLRSLGLPQTAARRPGDRTTLLRGALADRRVLLVVENVTDAAQFAGLLPVSRDGALLATGRSRAAVPEGTTVFEVTTPAVTDGVEMLTAMVGGRRVSAEPSEAIELTELCDGLPLALRIAAGRLRARPQWSLGDLTIRLRDGRRRLSELAHGELDLRDTLDDARRRLGEPARLLLTRLAALPGCEFAAWTAAPLLDTDTTTARRALAELSAVRLIVPGEDADHHRTPELVRLHSAECLAAEPAGREAAREATRRVLNGWLTLTEEAVLRLGDTPAPGPHRRQCRPMDLAAVEAVVGEPVVWFAGEQGALLAAVEQAADTGEHELCHRLAVAVCSLAAAQRAHGLWRECAAHGLESARRSGDRLGEATLLYSLGTLDEQQRRTDEARARLRGALGAFEQLGEEDWREMAAEALARLDRRIDSTVAPTVSRAGRPALSGTLPVGDRSRFGQGRFAKAAGASGPAADAARAAAGGGRTRHRPVVPDGKFPHRHRDDSMEKR